MKKLRKNFGLKMERFLKLNFGPCLTINIDSGKLQLFHYNQKVQEEVVEPESVEICMRKISVSIPEEYLEVSYLVSAGYFVVVDCQNLNESERKVFEKNLAIEMMKMGTHFENLSDNILLCSTNFSIVQMSEPPKKGKIYQFKDYEMVKSRG